MNAYFEYRNNGEKLEMILHAATNGGRNITVEDVIHSLDKFKLDVDDIGSINKTVTELSEDKVIAIGKAVTPFNAWCDYKMSRDGLHVYATYYPGFEGRQISSNDEIARDLQNIKVKYGINDEAITKLLAGNNYLEAIEVASGTLPVEGHDGYITYNFDAEKKAKPTIKEDGSVDYKNVDGLNHIKAGDVVATLTPEDKGVPGKNVFGQEILPNKVRKVAFRYGRNLEVSSDGLSLITQVNGHVTVADGRIFVSNVLEVVNVDNSTGNIEYDGDVLVTGNVVSGFEINATGNVEIRGIVEGATINAGGDVTLVRGVQGMNKASITCKGNMVTKFLESAENITVGGDLDTDTILHSKVNCSGTIHASGRNGLIVGGDVRSIHGIEAKSIGNEMGTATTVGAGIDPSLKKEIDRLKKEIVASNDNKNKLNMIVASLRKRQESGVTLEPEKLDMLQKTTRNMIMMEQEMKNMRTKLDELTALVTDDENARIKVHKAMYPGTRLIFGDVVKFQKDAVSYCQFAKKGADIVMLQL